MYFQCLQTQCYSDFYGPKTRANFCKPYKMIVFIQVRFICKPYKMMVFYTSEIWNSDFLGQIDGPIFAYPIKWSFFIRVSLRPCKIDFLTYILKNVCIPIVSKKTTLYLKACITSVSKKKRHSISNGLKVFFLPTLILHI